MRTNIPALIKEKNQAIDAAVRSADIGAHELSQAYRDTAHSIQGEILKARQAQEQNQS